MSKPLPSQDQLVETSTVKHKPNREIYNEAIWAGKMSGLWRIGESVANVSSMGIDIGFPASKKLDCSMFKGRHFDKSVILLCIRWYLTYNLSLRNLKEMMAGRSIAVDHSTVHRWVLHFSPMLLECFHRRKRPVTRKWNLDETYVKVKGEWLYPYRAIDSNGDTVGFMFSRNRDLKAGKRFIRKGLAQHGRPEKITIDGSQTNRMAIMQCDAENRLRHGGKLITICSSKYMNNTIEQDHRRVKRRIRSMLGFKAEAAASITLAGVMLVHMMRKLQGNFGSTAPLSLKQQFTALAA